MNFFCNAIRINSKGSEFKLSFFFAVTTIVLAGGLSEGGGKLSSANLIKIQFNEDNAIKTVNENNKHNLPTAQFGLFSTLCERRSIVGGGRDSNYTCYADVFEFDRCVWRKLPSLNTPRSYSASTYCNNHVIVAGGSDSRRNQLNTIEILKMNATDTSSTFITLADTLPVKVFGHTLTPFKGKTFLIGGRVSSGLDGGSLRSNAVYEGTFKNNRFSWKRVASLHHARSGHVTIPLGNDQLMVMGGDCWGKNSEIFDKSQQAQKKF